jgi:hypothetical protein
MRGARDFFFVLLAVFAKALIIAWYIFSEAAKLS